MQFSWGAAARLAPLLLAAGLLLGLDPAPTASASARLQRMLIGVGCYRIAAHASAAVPAYCLDQEAAVPPQGAVLADMRANLGEATVAAGGTAMPLGTALARHLLRIEGTDTPDGLSLTNLTDQPLSLCVTRPVVVMGEGEGYSADVKRIYDRIVDLMQAAAPTPDEHIRLQQRLWSLVNDEDARELAAPWPPTGTAAPPAGGCVPGGNGAVLCSH